MVQPNFTQTQDTQLRVRELVNALTEANEYPGIIDVSKLRYTTPLTLLPLCAYIYNLLEGSAPKVKSDSKSKSRILSKIGFPYGVDLTEKPELNEYIPISHSEIFTEKNKEPLRTVEDLSQLFKNLLISHLELRDEHSKNYEPTITYYLSEICDNVHQHSQARSLWVFGRFWKSRGELELCILDDGIGIKRSYDCSGFGTSNHVDAIRNAIEGVSTKGKDRGYGIGTTIKLITQEPNLAGQVCLISGNGCYLGQYGKTPQLGVIPFQWNGVIFCLRLKRPLKKPDIYPYIS